VVHLSTSCIGKSKQPRCFKEVNKSLETDYNIILIGRIIIKNIKENKSPVKISVNLHTCREDL